MTKKASNSPKPAAERGQAQCSLDTKDEVEAIVVAYLQIRYPHYRITPATKLDDTVGDAEARATLLPGWMMEATSDGGCETRLGSEDYRVMSTVQDIIDKIWDDLKDKCNL
jgi:hypothetical protein